MTKRYKIFQVNPTQYIIEDENHEWLMVTENTKYLKKVCEILNEQYEEIVDLKCHNEDLVQDNMYLEDRVANQHYKMKKLKKEVLKLKYFISTYCAEWECDECPLRDEDCVIEMEVE